MQSRFVAAMLPLLSVACGADDQADAPSARTEAAIAIPTTYRGVNLSSAEFGSRLPGTFGTDYTFPTTSEVDYYQSKGMNTFRVGFAWERLQPSAYGALEPTYLARLDAIVGYATSRGAYVVLNPHNFARYYGSVVGSTTVPSAVFADFWGKVASHYKASARVLFGLVNEPNTMPTEQWVSAANAAIASIRGAGASNVILAPGNGWTGAYSWYDSWYGTPNATAMKAIVDPQSNTLYEVHQYLDADSSGSSSTCVSSTIGRARLTKFVGWLRTNGKKGFVGELAGANNARCNAAVSDMLAYISANSDVLVGWTWWGGGPWWPSSYPFLLDPTSSGDRPQMKLLLPYLK